MAQEVNLNIEELDSFVGHIIENNRFLQKENKLPVAIEVVGESGIGKTSAVMQMAKKHELDFVKLNLAQIEELGDLVGFPVRQFQMYKEKTINVTPDADDLEYRSTQRGEDLAKITTVTKKIGQWVDELAVSD